MLSHSLLSNGGNHAEDREENDFYATEPAAAVFKAFTLLRQNGVPARIVKFRREDYFAFLNGRPDSQAERSAWAAMQTQKDKAP